MIWYAISLHFLYGGLLLVDENSTALALLGGFQNVLGPLGREATGTILLLVAVIALLGLAIAPYTNKWLSLGLLIPQYLLLLLAMFSTLEIIISGYQTSTGQNVPLPTILFAIGPIGLAAFWHSLAILEKLTMPVDHDAEIFRLRRRIVDLELERRDIYPHA